MRRIARVIGAITVAAWIGLVPQASATECTPKGCSGGCRPGTIQDAHIDPDTLTIELGDPIECTS